MLTRAAAVLALLLALSASASVTTTALTGRVLSGDAPAAGVTVTVTSPALLHARTTTTNSHGFYWLGSLPPGVYEVSFSRAGLSSLIRPALLELGRVARADARLEVNADEDAVTSTAVPVSVVDDPTLTSHFDEEELDRLPLVVDVVSAALLAPGQRHGPFLVDEVPISRADFIGYEVTEQMTVFRGALPLEFAESDAVALRTRAGGEEFTLSIRDTFFGDGDHVFESASGGRILPERLWFFASGWGGVEEGLNLKLTAQAGAAHNFTATYFDAGDAVAALRYTGIASESLTADAIVTSEEFANARLSFVYRDHVLTGGASDDAVYAYDRWSRGRFAAMGGVRFEDDQTSPRVAASFDVRGNGRQTMTASYGRYTFDEELFTAGFATAIGSTGIARIDYLRRNGENELQLDARYSLFGRLHTGGSYTFANEDFFEHRGNAWVGAELPIGEQEIGMTLLERFERDEWLTDFALRYTVPFPRFRLTAGGDVSNAFDDSAFSARGWRIWLRARL